MDFTLGSLGSDELNALAREDELMREVAEMGYLFQRPLTLDASETEDLLGISSSSLTTMIDDTLLKRLRV
ncbi:hypothetical protein LP421_30260 (plasmid) [Rhizobium sp. RCAM05350]|nr:hypothetical protein LP421_30260 [Rhizobium sp. RCAM05350]